MSSRRDASRRRSRGRRQALTLGFLGIVLSVLGKHTNGFPFFPNTGVNPPLTTFSIAKHSMSLLWAVPQLIGATIPPAVYFVIAFVASTTFWRVKFGPAALSPVTSSSALIQPTSEFSFFFPPVFFSHFFFISRASDAVPFPSTQVITMSTFLSFICATWAL